MPFIAWDDDLTTGVAEVDDQHKRMLQLVNQLNDAVLESHGDEILGQTLSELIDYTIYHFGTEERLMAASAYPDYVTHQAKHDALTRKVLDARRRKRNGEITISEEVLEFLRNWLLYHIRGTDQMMGQFLREKGMH